MENRKPMRSPMIPKLLFPKAANMMETGRSSGLSKSEASSR